MDVAVRLSGGDVDWAGAAIRPAFGELVGLKRCGEGVLHVLGSAGKENLRDVGELLSVKVQLIRVHGIGFGEIVKPKVEHDDVPLDFEVGPQGGAQPPAVLQVEEAVCRVVGTATPNPWRVLNLARGLQERGHSGSVPACTHTQNTHRHTRRHTQTHTHTHVSCERL
jgi:hypothetical protein